ncbi:hypothetical protein M514_04403 [Trichuris suis]|uniref:Uncharacterized protein n=1 Tax=Trichuris suis TaxID=68888 RepID=A0A085MBV7_9BILA|nr:hypothetical protein M513_04403 [Trichuris suis]KFD64356.1 hypothetical protein M514_04403 [Trichuris suis]
MNHIAERYLRSDGPGLASTRCASQRFHAYYFWMFRVELAQNTPSQKRWVQQPDRQSEDIHR